MRQTLHIFRKDVRFLWAPILLVLALTAAAAWLRMAEPAGMARGSAVPASPATAATYFLTMSWWYLVLAAIHKERPTGNRQFWVTRPYGWRSLLGAKLLLVIAFINLPYLISDVAILHANGLVPSVMSLLARQVAITGVLLLPVAALATVTRNAAETVLAVLGVLVAALYAALHGSGPAQLWGALEWMHVWAAVALWAVASAATLGWQYAWRRTLAAWGILVVGAGICYGFWVAPPAGAAASLATIGPEPEALRQVHLSLAFDSGRGLCSIREGQLLADGLPLRVDGLAAGMMAEVEFRDLGIVGPNLQWHSRWASPSADWFRGAPWWDRLCSADQQPMPGAAGAGKTPVHVKVSAVMTVYGPPITTAIAADGRRHEVPGIGVCEVEPVSDYSPARLTCHAAGYPAVRLRAQACDFVLFRYELSPAALEASPVVVRSVLLRDLGLTPQNREAVQVITQRPVARIRRDLDLADVRLWSSGE